MTPRVTMRLEGFFTTIQPSADGYRVVTVQLPDLVFPRDREITGIRLKDPPADLLEARIVLANQIPRIGPQFPRRHFEGNLLESELFIHPPVRIPRRDHHEAEMDFVFRTHQEAYETRIPAMDIQHVEAPPLNWDDPERVILFWQPVQLTQPFVDAWPTIRIRPGFSHPEVQTKDELQALIGKRVLVAVRWVFKYGMGTPMTHGHPVPHDFDTEESI